MATPKQLLDVERGQIGYDRHKDPLQGTIYGRWLAELTGNKAYAQNGVPFCAMGQSWSFAQVKQDAPGMPCAGCGDIRNAAKRQGRVVSDRRSAQPGDIVLFRWDGNINDDSYSDHVGIVELNLGRNRGIQTIEYNTGNGRVMRRTRSWSVVQYIIRPAWSGGASIPAQKPAKPLIEVDGLWGANTTLSIQIQAGCPYVDGIVSRQNPKHKWRMAGCTTGWEYVYPDGDAPGSYTVKAVQKVWGVEPDGILGPDSINAGIAWGMKHGSGATKLDARFDWKSATIKTMQRKLNDGTFFK